jgi:hypothetical protein
MDKQTFARMRDEYNSQFAPRPRYRVMLLGDNSGVIAVSGDPSMVWVRDTAGNVERVKKNIVAANAPADTPLLIGDTPGYSSNFSQVMGIAIDQIDTYGGANYMAAFVGAAQQIGYGDSVGNLTGSNVLKWTGSQIQLDPDSLASILITVYHASNNPFILGRRARGTKALPTQIQSGDIMLRLSGTGYDDAPGFSGTSKARVDLTALETWTTTAHGAAVELWGTKAGTTTPVKSARAKGDGFESIIGGQVNRVLATGTALTLSDGYSLTVNRYYQLQGTAALRLEGDAEMRIL